MIPAILYACAIADDALSPGIPTTLLLPRRMLLLGTDASRRATGSRPYVVAYHSRSSAYTRYRNRSYAPSSN